MKVGQKALFLELSPTTGKVSELHLDEYFKNGNRISPDQSTTDTQGDKEEANSHLPVKSDLNSPLQTHEFKLWVDDTDDVELKSGQIELSEVITSPKVINTDHTQPSWYFVIGGRQNPVNSPYLAQTCCFLYTQFGRLIRRKPLLDYRKHMVLQVVKKFVRLGDTDEEGTIQGYRQRWIYSIGGMHGGGQKAALPNKTIERYDVVGDQWTRIKCLLNYNQSFASSVVVHDRFIYVFKGDIDSCTFEVLDIEMADTWQHCKKIAVAMEIELTSSQVFFITEEECLLILGGIDN